ncbi:MAG TPA: cupredoxin domain-containing protein [Pseudolabrys sp.]|nr:cupredoxin domain-containing protein [Pseudolabrys sp.]
MKMLLIAGAAAVLIAPALARADDFTLTIKDHTFTPSEVKVAAGKRHVITVVNDDATPEEFESHALKIEKVVPGKSKGIVRIGPLKAGRYPFVGEYHESTAKGVIVAE